MGILEPVPHSTANSHVSGNRCAAKAPWKQQFPEDRNIEKPRPAHKSMQGGDYAALCMVGMALALIQEWQRLLLSLWSHSDCPAGVYRSLLPPSLPPPPPDHFLPPPRNPLL